MDFVRDDQEHSVKKPRQATQMAVVILELF